MDKQEILSKEGIQLELRDLLVKILEAAENGQPVTITIDDVEGLRTELDSLSNRIDSNEGGGV